MADKDRADKWLELVKEDLSVAELLFDNGHWLYTGFMCHQVVEKHSKPIGASAVMMTHRIFMTIKR